MTKIEGRTISEAQFTSALSAAETRLVTQKKSAYQSGLVSTPYNKDKIKRGFTEPRSRPHEFP
jgi:hypothetical protein